MVPSVGYVGWAFSDHHSWKELHLNKNNPSGLLYFMESKIYKEKAFIIKSSNWVKGINPLDLFGAVFESWGAQTASCIIYTNGYHS